MTSAKTPSSLVRSSMNASPISVCRSDPVRVDHPAVAARDYSGALVAVALEGSELQPGRAARAQRIVRFGTVQLEQSA